jgi:hypothetical protein
MSETEYLAREIADARAALQSSVAELKPNATAALDLAAWAKAYPWPAVGAAAATGFALAVMFRSRANPPKPQVASATDDSTSQPAASPAPPVNEKPSPSFFASISPALFDLAKLIIETVVMTAIRAAQAPDQQVQRGDKDSEQP